MAVKRGIKPQELDFQKINLFQELVMQHSSFEGILSDTLRAICFACPDVMKKRKKIEWERILSCDGWDALVSMLVERYVHDMGWAPLEKRLTQIRDDFNLEIEFQEDDIATVKEVELIRNLIVHNGGKVNQEYMTFKKANDLKIGDYIPLDDDYLEHISTTLQMLASEIYIEISRKYFGKKREELLKDIQHRDKGAKPG